MAASAVDLILPEIRVVGSLARDDLNRVVVLASYALTGRITRSLATLIDQFESNDYRVVLVRASDSARSVEWIPGYKMATVVIYKANIGYDFGSWATALAYFPYLANTQRVIFANDSLLGPFSSLRPMLHDFESAKADVWGVTNSIEVRPHLQSYLLGFKGGVLGDRTLKNFWRKIRPLANKDAIVAEYEIGFSRLLSIEGYLTQAWFDHSVIVPDGGNPTTIGGSALLRAGFPFVKRILINNPDIFPDAEIAIQTLKEIHDSTISKWE